MRRLKGIPFYLVGLVLILGSVFPIACGNNSSPTKPSAPVTVVELVTATPVYTSTPTVTPTITFTPANTSTPTITSTPTVTSTPTPTPSGILIYWNSVDGGSAMVDAMGDFYADLYIQADGEPSSSLAVTLIGPGGSEAIPFLKVAYNAFGGGDYAQYDKNPFTQTCQAGEPYTIVVSGAAAGSATITGNMPGPINVNEDGQAVTWINAYSDSALAQIDVDDTTEGQGITILGPDLVSPVSIPGSLYSTTDNYEILAVLLSSNVNIAGAIAGSAMIFTNSRMVTVDPQATPAPSPSVTPVDSWNNEVN